jgi:hypothetical protein
MWWVCKQASDALGASPRRRRQLLYPYPCSVVTWQTEGLRVGCGGMGGWVGLQKLITFFSYWVGLQKLITDLDMKNGYKGGA